MENICAFSKDHKCILWSDYEVTHYALEEANTLCHENWIEIQKKDSYIRKLQDILSKHNIEIPGE